MAKFLGGPKAQYLDSNGDPLSGGKLHTYDPGTTDNKATYPTIADAIAKSNANANPVVLDSRGEASVVLAGNTKLVLKTSADVTLWTEDNVNNDSGTILDDNGNELLALATTASAVNYLSVANSATGDDVVIQAAGSDTNIGITLTPKGSGTIDIGTLSIDTPFTVQGTASSSSEIRLEEDTDNGDNYISLKAPASIAANITYDLPGTDGATNTSLITNGSGTLSFGAVTGVAATLAEMETATDVVAPVTAGRTQYHPGVAKVWVQCDAAGNADASRNVTSITDTGTGTATVNYSITLSAINYAAFCHVRTAAGNTYGGITDIDTTSASLTNRDSSDNVADPTKYFFVAFGDI